MALLSTANGVSCDMLIRNARFPDKDFNFIKGDILIENGLIAGIGSFDGGDCLDAEGLTVLPGFVDIHIHGALLADCSSGNPDDVQTVSRFLLSKGVTSFCPTTMTLPHDQIEAAFSAAGQCVGKEEGARILGVNMEGPYISHEKKGAQAEEFIRKPDIGELEKLNSLCPVALTDIAPEVDGALRYAEKASLFCTVSAAHTAATFEQASDAFRHGFTHVTHLFNAMTPFLSREPGVPGAVFDSENVTAELICDGCHVHPSVIRSAFRLLGEDRLCVISDALPPAGEPDGEYDFSGQKIIVRDGLARLPDGTIAGSTTNLFDEFKNLLSFGISEKAAVKACTINPAKAVKADRDIGSIEIGKRADLLIIDENKEIVKVIKGERYCEK